MFNDGTDGQTSCSCTEHKTRTFSMSESDIKDVSNTSPCVPGSVCYWSEWDISSSMSTSDHITAQSCTSDSKIFCIKPAFNDICSDLTTTFTSGNCSPFRLTRNIPVGFLNPSDINSTVQPKLPAEINTTLPSQCRLTTDYTCQENGRIKELSELEPFTDYSCIGHIKDMNNDTIINTTDIPVRINCDLQIINMKTGVTNTSVHLSWTTTSTNCHDVLPTLPKLSYDCSCSPAHNTLELIVFKDPPGGTCEIKGLQSYTNHTCTVQPKYNNNLEGTSAEVIQKTETGIPDAVSYMSVYSRENGAIAVHCEYYGRFKGPEKKFIARLYVRGDAPKLLKEETQENCNFVFKDLSNSTTHMVKVTAFNGEYESRPFIQYDYTIYKTNGIVFIFRLSLITIGIIIMITCVVIYNRKSRDDAIVDVRLQSTAVYVNERHPGLRKRA
ncbi:uncharacterized protein AB9X84_016293 [Acanthopagrus schlegelii]